MMIIKEYGITRVEELYGYEGHFVKEERYDLGVTDTLDRAKNYVQKFIKDNVEKYRDKYKEIGMEMEIIDQDTIEISGSVFYTLIHYEITEYSYAL